MNHNFGRTGKSQVLLTAIYLIAETGDSFFS